jgi:hypothetical protein
LAINSRVFLSAADYTAVIFTEVYFAAFRGQRRIPNLVIVVCCDHTIRADALRFLNVATARLLENWTDPVQCPHLVLV